MQRPKICWTFSLPLNNAGIPRCRNDSERSFIEPVISHLIATQKDHCEKACVVKEYQIQEWMDFSFSEPRSYNLRYRFVLPTASTEGESKRPFKLVYKEYLIMTLISLIGNTGGTFGMFIGFSFFGTFIWLLGVAEKIRSYTYNWTA